ncbi:MAG: DUF6288 domain-containing protein [Akkermansiaceae bacterium]|nr:DUF6288 domain-containing protein [Akkermansiaceae bacterium]
MGPTGLTGATGKKEIKITEVDKGSPADGKLKKGDVVIGVNGKKFSGNPRRELAKAINEAEGPAQKGRLVLTLKGGKSAELQLKAYGTFSPTAPANCAKTDALVTAIAERLIADEEGLKDDRLPVGHLGLMATGEKKYLDYVKASLPKQSWANPDREAMIAVTQGGKDMGLVSWYWGYSLIALAEYQLLTGDKSVLPAIEAYALALSKGQCAAGTWGHRMISTARDGRLPGYSHINQPSLACFIGLNLAQACGISDPELDEAVERCAGFFETYVGKGTIPYGVHDPNSRDFNNNGMSGSAAIAMSLAGNQDAARFFSRQVAADYDRLETGHASYFFNVLWSPLGANVAGPEVTQEYHKRSRWLYTLYRTWDDRFTYNGKDHKAINTDGALLLNYCTPRKVLFITGKDADESIWASREDAMAICDQSQIDYKSQSIDGLLALFGHEAPQVRRRAVWALREREGDFLGKVEELIRSGSPLEKDSAIGFFGYKCPPEWAGPRMELIGGVLRDPEAGMELKQQAASAVSWHQPHAKTYYQDMIGLLAAEKEDPYGVIEEGLGNAIVIASKNPHADGLVKDKKLFYEAVRRLSRNPRQGARGNAMKMIAHMPAEDFPLVAEEVRMVVRNRNPEFHSYHNPGATLGPGGQVLARLGIEDGIDWAMETLDTADGKHSFKIRAVQSVLQAYGVYSKDAVEIIKADEKLMRSFAGGRFARGWKKILENIDNEQKPTPRLISFEEAKEGKTP